MAITNPDLLDRPIASRTGQLSSASQIIRENNETAETAFTNIESYILNWKFNGNITNTTDPGADFLALNNVFKDNATVITFNTESNVDDARFDEILSQLRPGNRIFLQERAAANKSILYRVTAAPTLDGTKVDVTVARERDQGGEFTNNGLLNVAFFFNLGGVDSSFLDEVLSVGSNFNFSNSVQVLQQNLSNVTLPTNAPYDQIARYLFGGASLEANDVADRIEYTSGYSLGIDYRDNASGPVNDDNHYVDSGITVVGDVNSNVLTYPPGTTNERLIAFQIQLNAGNTGQSAMISLDRDGVGPLEFVHINTLNQVEIDTDPTSGTGTHSTLRDGTGSITITDGAWIMIELVPAPSGVTDSWEVVPVILQADGTRIQCNNVVVNLTDINSAQFSFSRSTAQRGQIIQFKAIQIPGYLYHSQLSSRWDHVNDKWVFGYARLFEASDEDLVQIVRKLKGPLESTIGVPLPTVPTAGQIVRINAAGDGYEAVETSRNIKATAIGGTGNSVLTLPDDYTNFELLTVSVLEDAGATFSLTLSTRTLEDNASIATITLSGNDTASWLGGVTRTLTLDSVSDSWTDAILSIPRL